MEHNAHRRYVHMVILVISVIAITAALYSSSISFKPLAVGNVKPLTNLGDVFKSDEGFENGEGRKETGGKITADADDRQMRLPDHILPIEYNLTLKVYVPGYGYKANEDDRKNLTFEGEVSIGFLVNKSTSSITLNAAELNTTHTSIYVAQQNSSFLKPLIFSSIGEDKEREEIIIRFEDQLTKGTVGIIEFGFNAPIRQDMEGLYQTHYTQNGEPKIAVVSQFQPVSLRKMVPCFDEPIFKAVWNVEIIHPVGTVAIANGEQVEQSEEPGGEFLRTLFSPTPKMSTYLLAMFISEFEQNTKTTRSGVQFRVWSRPESVRFTDYALNAGVKCLEFYEKYFGLSFPLRKIDMVAIPDFAAGAMENWGLITYRENAVLYNSRVFTGNNKRRIAELIAHELAHQWYGNLVTMKWWNDLWLNEGFATFMEQYGVDHISDGHFKQVDIKLIDSQNPALRTDSVASSHPLSVRIDRATEILDYFDRITYDKGGSVIHMIEKTMGKDSFRKGINHYLNKFALSNADVDDLFESLNERMPEDSIGPDGQKLDITKFADPWLKQMAYPVVHVARHNSSHMKMRQEKFRLSKNAEEKKKFQNPKWGYKWDVPIWYNDVDFKKPKMVWLRPDESLCVRFDELAIVNINSDGFYRVSYSEDLWEEIIEKISTGHKSFSSRTIARLIDDAFVSASIGMIDYSTPIKLVSYLQKEDEHIPWAVALSHFKVIAEHYEKGDARKPFDDFQIELIKKSPALQSTTFVASHFHDDRMFSEVNVASLLITSLCDANVKNYTDIMSRAFGLTIPMCPSNSKPSECSEIPAPFRRLVYCQGVKEGGKAEFEKVVSWLEEETDPIERENLELALGCSTDVETLISVLLLCLQPGKSFIKPQDIFFVFTAISQSEHISDEQLLNFLINEWKIIEKIPTRAYINHIIASMTNGVKTLSMLQKLDEFLEKTPSTKNFDFDKIREGIMLKIQWRDQFHDVVIGHFKKATEDLKNQS